MSHRLRQVSARCRLGWSDFGRSDLSLPADMRWGFYSVFRTPEELPQQIYGGRWTEDSSRGTWNEEWMK